MEVTINAPNASIKFWNEAFVNGSTIISEGPGKTATLYQVYGQSPFSPGDADIWLSGVTGPAEIAGEWITIQMLQNEPFMSPIHRATDAIFSHLPPVGMQIQTRTGTFRIKRNN